MINWPCLICERGSRLSTLNIKANVYANSTFMWYNHGTYWRSRRDWNFFILRTYCLVCYYYYQLEKCFCIPSLIGFDPLEHRLFRVNQLTLEVCYYLLIFTDVSDWRGWGNQANYGLSTTHKMVTLFPGLVVRIALYTSIPRKVFGKSARDNPERYSGWFWVHCSSKKFERMSREAIEDLCLRVLKETTKVGSTATVSGTVYWSYVILPVGNVKCKFFFPTIQNSCITKTE